jgi:glyoxylase-like metal-dependent hydrolase (beta-lactamase superfamily II)
VCGGAALHHREDMSEPKAMARKIVRVVPTVHRWRVHDERIGGGESDAYAVVNDGRVTLIDPLPVDAEALDKLGKVSAIVLTAGNHQRAAWRLRKAYGVHVFAPENAYGLEEQPDYFYSGGDALPGGLTAFHAPGPVASMHALWLSRPVSVIFLSDLLMHDGSGLPTFVPARYQDEPARTRASIRRILDHLPVDVLCFAHGPPICADGRAALQRALDEDHEELAGEPAY